MYIVKIYDGPNDNEGIVIHSPYSNGLKLSSGTANIVGEGISDMTFRVNPSNPAWNNIKPLNTLIQVTEARTGKVVFDGRVLKPVQSMAQDGAFTIEYTCESKLAYLNDSSQRHGEYRNMTVADFFRVIIDNHNRRVEPYKRFKVGNVTVTNTTDNVYRYLGYERTFPTIKDKLIDRLGGFLRIREEYDGTYIDYLESVGETKRTPIRLRSNLKDMSREIDPTEVITRLVPLGARIESEDETAVDASQARLTIDSVNGGVDYMDDAAMMAEFGVIEGSIVFDEINTPSILKLRGEQFFQAQRAARVSYSVNALDLSLIDTTFETFEVDNWHPIQNPVLAIDEPVQIIGKKIDINEPQKSSLTIGDKYRTLSQYQANANKQMQTVQTLENRVDRLASANSNLTMRLQQAQSDLQGIQDDLMNVDVKNLPAELQSISGQITALQRNIDDLVIPEYGPVTASEAGLMSPSDKRKLDLVKATTLVDLDDLKRRVIALEQPPEPTDPEEPIDPMTEGGTQ